MNHSPLHDVHLQFGAKMVEFAGWMMPLTYRGIIEEHNFTRTGCSVFDVSHMGRLRIRGADAQPFLQWICTRNLDKMEDGVCRYSHICREDGGILDDVIVSRYAADHWLVVCNASNREKVLAWLERHSVGRQVDITDQTFETAMIALQGPGAIDLAGAMIPIDLSGVKRYRFATGSTFGISYSVFRSGYTGEDGYEVIVPAGVVGMFIPALLGSGDAPRADIKPAGLGARDTLRLEAGMPLYGHELSEDIDSLSAGQSWCVDLSVDFIGADAMRASKERGPKVKLVGLEIEGRRIARQHAAVFAEQLPVGEVTSGTMSPTLGKNIAMASIALDYAAEGKDLQIDFGRQKASAKVVPLPFYKRPKTQ